MSSFNKNTCAGILSPQNKLGLVKDPHSKYKLIQGLFAGLIYFRINITGTKITVDKCTETEATKVKIFNKRRLFTNDIANKIIDIAKCKSVFSEDT